MNISIIIPNYNGAPILPNNLSKVFVLFETYQAKEKNEIEVIIVDDGSTDNSREVLADILGNYTNSLSIRLLFNDKNYGFSTTVNKGVAAAKGEIVILLNTDVVPHKGFLEPLLSHFADESVFGVGCMDESIEIEKTLLRGRGVGKWKQGLLIHSAGDLDYNDTLWVSCGSGAFRKSIWDNLGGLSEILNPFYWEDIDIGYRALKSGYTLLFDKNSVVTHIHEEGSIKKTQSNDKVHRIAYRNQHLFTLLNVTDKKILLDFILFSSLRILQRIKVGDIASLKGIFGAFLLVPKIIQYRRRNTQHFILSDKEVISRLKR